MRIITAATILVLSLLMMSCSTLSQQQVATWIDSKTEAPELNVAGSWQSVVSMFAGGWGNASLIQSGPQVNGTLGLYTVEGRVAGKKLYLMILSGNRVYYTAVIEQNKEGALSGMAYSKILPDDPQSRYADRAPIALVRVQGLN